jgi:anti-sigma factor RsiW
MKRLDCEQLLPHLESYGRGDASDELRLLADDHLARCTSCRRRLAHLKQVTAMLAAWRPMPVPSGLKADVAAAVSHDLGQRAREVFPRRLLARRRRRRASRPRSPMTGYQRLATWLLIASLLFLGAAIVYRMIQGAF